MVGVESDASSPSQIPDTLVSFIPYTDSLIPVCSRTRQTAELGPFDLDFFAEVCIGPGSYTASIVKVFVIDTFEARRLTFDVYLF
jgi:hypothetical protein